VGKSSLAPFVARNLAWQFLEHVVTSRTEAADLLYTFDAVRKLADAQRRSTGAAAIDDRRYLRPGVLWWAFDPESAAALPRSAMPDLHHNAGRASDASVILIDEIDKADPDVPNSLLVPLGSNEFEVPALEHTVRMQKREWLPPTVASPMLLIITTNGERELPAAFVRRCLVCEVVAPDVRRMVDIARRHIRAEGGAWDQKTQALSKKLAGKVDGLRKEALKAGVRPPGVAEVLDALHACRSLGIHVDSKEWAVIERLTLRKDQTGGSPA
jgi:MoxR-like ATPase